MRPRIERQHITWRQEVGGSSIEASKIAGHSDLEMTIEYTFVAPERQNELTRRIQEKLAGAARSGARVQPANAPTPTPPASSAPEVPPNLGDAAPVTSLVR